MTTTKERRCHNCAAWGAHDGSVLRAPCVLIPSTDENQFERPIARVVNTMSTAPQRVVRNVRIETPRDYGCRLHRFPEECDAE